jgi:hypothetical protein
MNCVIRLTLQPLKRGMDNASGGIYFRSTSFHIPTPWGDPEASFDALDRQTYNYC